MNIATITHNLDNFLELLFFGAPIRKGLGLPEPPAKVAAKTLHVPTTGGRLVNRETNTWEWDIARTRPVSAPAELTQAEAAEMIRRGQKNMTWNARVKLARVQGQTIAEAAKAAGCGFSTAQKIYATLSAFEHR